MVPATTSMILATHAVGNAILLYYMFHPLLEHDSIVMVSICLPSCVSILLCDAVKIYPSLDANNLLNISFITSFFLRLTGTHGSQYYHRNCNSTETNNILCRLIMPTFNYPPMGMSTGRHHLYLYPNTKRTSRTILSQLLLSFEQPHEQYSINCISNNISTLLISTMRDQL